MTTTDAYATGFMVGNLLYVLVLVLIFWFVGRWGLIGLIIRIVCAGLLVLRILSFLALVHPPGS
jgi:hypothetical protein